ncbi:MAG TPA: hypothetical protein VFM71_12990 [Gemmatimonadaceae bacterium]|nr:hypothetical protein [Gemmatimonadaceae bacterium]
MTRKRLATAGERGELVRLFQIMGRQGAYVVQWGPTGARRQRSWPATKAGKVESKAFFDAFVAEHKQAAGDALMTRGMWLAYIDDVFPSLRPNSRRLYTEAWKHWELFYGAETDAAALTVAQCTGFRRALEERGFALTTARATIKNVRGVYNWAEKSERITVNKWHRFTFRVPKGMKPKPRAEYRADEFLRIWRALHPEQIGQWRAWCLVGLLGIYGNRQHAILALDDAWEHEDEIIIPASVEKTGEEAVLPLLPLTRRILAVARSWRAREGYTGTRVFFPGQRPGRTHPSKQAHYSIQSLTDALHLAEKRAGVPHIPGRAGHGFRRGLVGDLADATGDVGLALQAIGDSLAMAPHYRVRRNDRIRTLLSDRLARMGAETPAEPATETATKPRNPPSHRS